MSDFLVSFAIGFAVGSSLIVIGAFIYTVVLVIQGQFK